MVDGNIEKLNMILDLDLSKISFKHNLLIMRATKYGDLTMIRELILRGADPTTRHH